MADRTRLAIELGEAIKQVRAILEAQSVGSRRVAKNRFIALQSGLTDIEEVYIGAIASWSTSSKAEPMQDLVQAAVRLENRLVRYRSFPYPGDDLYEASYMALETLVEKVKELDNSRPQVEVEPKAGGSGLGEGSNPEISLVLSDSIQQPFGCVLS